MIYNPAKIKKLYASIDNRLTDEEKEIMQEILGQYNKLLAFDKWKYEDIGRKEKEIMDRIKENELLIIKKKKLEEKLDIQLQINKVLRERLEEQ